MMSEYFMLPILDLREDADADYPFANNPIQLSSQYRRDLNDLSITRTLATNEFNSLLAAPIEVAMGSLLTDQVFLGFYFLGEREDCCVCRTNVFSMDSQQLTNIRTMYLDSNFRRILHCFSFTSVYEDFS